VRTSVYVCMCVYVTLNFFISVVLFSLRLFLFQYLFCVAKDKLQHKQKATETDLLTVESRMANEYVADTHSTVCIVYMCVCVCVCV